MKIGYHCSHEQFRPRDLLVYVIMAEAAGFTHFMSSDHFNPWSVRQGQSGFCWSWLGAALQSGQGCFGSLAIPGGHRLHPAILAQAIATLAQIYPHRLPWIAAGSGEAMNEHITGETWPEKDTRNRRLLQGVEIMRALWRGETVTLSNGDIRTHRAKLWTRPEIAPQIHAAALSPETAAWAGSWADGLITVRQEENDLKTLLAAFRENGGAGRPAILQLQISWDVDYERARQNAWDQWRHLALHEDPASLATPEAIDEQCAAIKPEDMEGLLPIVTRAEDIAALIALYRALGFDELYLHNAGRNQREFIAMCGDQLFPLLRAQNLWPA